VGIGLEFVSALFLLTVFAAPLLLARRWPVVNCSYLLDPARIDPGAGASFSHPVTDRYLFFPSIER